MSNHDPIRAALGRLVDAVDGRRWDAKEYQDAIAAARATLATPPAVDGPAVPADYIDAEHTGQDWRLLETFYAACQAACQLEDGTADEIHLRGIRAVLAAAQAQAPAPVEVEGEAEELAAKLRRLSYQNPLGVAAPTITCAAALLQAQAAELATLRAGVARLHAGLVALAADAPQPPQSGEVQG